MRKIEIEKIEQYSSFITRNGKRAKFIKYLPTANPKARLVFLVEEKVLCCDEKGVCWTINGIDSLVSETRYVGYDVFVDTKNIGWLNIQASTKKDKSILAECSPVIYSSQEEALKNMNEKTYKTLKIEWSVE